VAHTDLRSGSCILRLDAGSERRDSAPNMEGRSVTGRSLIRRRTEAHDSLRNLSGKNLGLSGRVSIGR
jgi:hypothetical protein